MPKLTTEQIKRKLYLGTCIPEKTWARTRKCKVATADARWKDFAGEIITGAHRIDATADPVTGDCWLRSFESGLYRVIAQVVTDPTDTVVILTAYRYGRVTPADMGAIMEDCACGGWSRHDAGILGDLMPDFCVKTIPDLLDAMNSDGGTILCDLPVTEMSTYEHYVRCGDEHDTTDRDCIFVKDPSGTVVLYVGWHQD